MRAIGRADLAGDQRFTDNAGRVRHQSELDAAIAAWTSQRTTADVLMVMDEAAVPAGPIYDAADMLADPHFNQRGLYQQVEVDGKPVKIPAITPFLSDTPGATDWPGPELKRP